MRRIVFSCMAVVIAASSSSPKPLHAQAISFSGTFNGMVTSQGPGRCGAGQTTVGLAVSGFLSPFGAATGTQSFCIIPGPGVLDVTDGLFDISFVGQGRLLGTFFGTLTPSGPTTYTGMSNLTITGGTGLFEGASGGGTSTGTEDIATGSVTFAPVGSVSGPRLATPEPGSLALLAGGLGGLAAVARARRRQG